MTTNNLMRDRQRPLYELYKQEPAAAWVTDMARTDWSYEDPLHTTVIAGPAEPVRVPIAVHTAVGGDSDEAVPGDLLCAALASCIDSTMRVIANRLRVPLKTLSVEVTAEVDVRGTLLMDSAVPVGFQRMDARIHLETGDGVDDAKRAMLIGVAEQCCVVLKTLKDGVPIDVRVTEGEAEGGPGPAKATVAH